MCKRKSPKVLSNEWIDQVAEEFGLDVVYAPLRGNKYEDVKKNG
jgi:hypothetical protein